MVHQTLAILVPTFILLAGVVDDLRSRKVHNKLVLMLMAAGILSTFSLWGSHGLIFALIAGLVAALICLPLVITGILGAGDMKLLVAFGLATSWNVVVWVLVYSFVWGALLGVIRAVLRGEGRMLMASTLSVAMLKKASPFPLQKIPYTVALFFGWLTYLSFSHFGGLL